MPTEIPGCLLKGLRPLAAGTRSQDGEAQPIKTSARGCPCHVAGLAGQRSQDGEAQPACSERRAGCP
jgi:hypothetical protein